MGGQKKGTGNLMYLFTPTSSTVIKTGVIEYVWAPWECGGEKGDLRKTVTFFQDLWMVILAQRFILNTM